MQFNLHAKEHREREFQNLRLEDHGYRGEVNRQKNSHQHTVQTKPTTQR